MRREVVSPMCRRLLTSSICTKCPRKMCARHVFACCMSRARASAQTLSTLRDFLGVAVGELVSGHAPMERRRMLLLAASTCAKASRQPSGCWRSAQSWDVRADGCGVDNQATAAEGASVLARGRLE